MQALKFFGVLKRLLFSGWMAPGSVSSSWRASLGEPEWAKEMQELLLQYLLCATGTDALEGFADSAAARWQW